MGVELLNARGATPEFVLNKALESKPQSVLVLLHNADGSYTSLMSYMPSQAVAWFKCNFDAQVNEFFSGRLDDEK